MTLLEKANAAIKNKKYEEAIDIYEKVVKSQPEMAPVIDFNLRYARKKIGMDSPGIFVEKKSEVALIAQETQKEIYEGNLEVCKDDYLKGWAVQKGKPSAIFDLTVYIDNILFCKIKNDIHRNDLVRHKKSTGKGGFSFYFPKELNLMEMRNLEIRYPDGKLLASLPIPKQKAVAQYQSVRSLDQENVSIIVPVYNAASDLKICIERLVKYTNDNIDIILIDDASPDPEIQLILNEAKSYENIRIFENKINLGFTRTINRGIELAGENDVVFLNSDARVTPKWLEGLKAALATDPKIATVTPMSDRAGAFSAPDIGNENVLPEGVTEEEYAIAFRRRSVGIYPKVPTGNGFCLYVRRKCINEIGPLDAEAFPRGYGEENDFCMRALRSGWSNVIDDRTYVFHDRSKSFGEAKTELMKAGLAVVNERYPEYKLAIRVFSACGKIALARYHARLAMQDCLNNHKSAWIPRILFVIATQTGGTPQTNRDLMEALSDVFEGWILRCDSEILELSRMDYTGKTQLVRSHRLQEPVDALTHNSYEYDKVVSNWLQELDFNLVHIRHLGWHSLSLPRLSKNLGIKVVYSFHDFYSLSPSFKLIDDTGVFQGNTFFEKGSVYRESLWPKDALPTPHGSWLTFWRERFQAALEYCDALVTTADSARKLIMDAMPQLPANRFVVIPHGRDFPEFHRIRQKTKPGERIRILVPGHINAMKGLEVIRALIEHDKAEKLEFHVLGRLIGEAPKKGIVTLGAYERHEFAKKAATVRPHLGIMFSVWDETYCHTLTELWSVGLPAAVLNFPNVADRVRCTGAGWVLDHHNIDKLYEEILRIAVDEQEYERTEQALTSWQDGYGLANSNAQMAAGYLNIYSDVLSESSIKSQNLSLFSRTRIGVVSPASEDLRHAPGSTHIRIWERIRNAVDRDVTYIKMTPVMLLACAREKMLDGVIIQRTAIPQDMVETVVRELSREKIPYLLDLDDDLLDVPKDKDTHGSYASYVPFLKKLIGSAKLVTVSTPALQKRMKNLHESVVLLPNQLSDFLWRRSPQTRIQDNSIRALYMGSPTHDDDLSMVIPALDAVAQLNPKFRLTLIGVTTNKGLVKGRPWLEILEAPAKDYVNFTQWLLKQAGRFDFSIAPLRETNFNARKSDLKLLDCGALGLPVIASDVSVYRATNASGVRLVENTTLAWKNALQAQVTLGAGNYDLGKQLRQWVIRERMLAKTLPDFDALISGLVLGKGASRKKSLKKNLSKKRIAVCVHIFYPHRWGMISEYLHNIEQEFDLFITCPTSLASKLTDIKSDYPEAVIIPVENIGMDVFPFLKAVRQYKLYHYDAVLKLHTKNDKSEVGDVLGQLALDGVLGTPTLVSKVLSELLSLNEIGMIGSECLYRSALKVMYNNRPNIEKVLKAMSLDWPKEEWGFFVGTMFWVQGALLEKIAFNYNDIISNLHAETELASTGGDGQWAHGMERFFGFLPVSQGKKVAVSYPSNEKSGHTNIRSVLPVSHGSLKAFHGFSMDHLSRYKNLSRWAEQCRNSELFDEVYYREQAGDLLTSEMDAATHFILFGDLLGLNPSKKFSSSDYMKKDVDKAAINPSIPSLIKFIKHDG